MMPGGRPTSGTCWRLRLGAQREGKSGEGAPLAHVERQEGAWHAQDQLRAGRLEPRGQGCHSDGNEPPWGVEGPGDALKS